MRNFFCRLRFVFIFVVLIVGTMLISYQKGISVYPTVMAQTGSVHTQDAQQILWLKGEQTGTAAP